MIDKILTHPKFDAFLDNFGTLFNPPRRKELQLERIIAADDIVAIAKCITDKIEANQKVNGNRCPVVYWACSCKSYKVLLYLLEKKADCNQPDTGVRLRPLESCAGEGKLSLTRLLMVVGNADARLVVLRSKKVTIYDMADNDIQELIKMLEAKKWLFKQLQQQYNQQKALADKAYKQADMSMARELEKLPISVKPWPIGGKNLLMKKTYPS